MDKYRKAVVAALGAGLTVAQTALPLTDVQRGWVVVALAAVTAAAVYVVPNGKTQA